MNTACSVHIAIGYLVVAYIPRYVLKIRDNSQHSYIFREYVPQKCAYRQEWGN